MSESQKTFFNEGLRRYGEAFSVIRLFQDEVESTLAAAIDDKQDWAPFQPFKRGDPISFSRRALKGNGRPFISAVIKGKLEGFKKPLLEIGFWWDPPALEEKLILYSHFRKPKELRLRPLDSKTDNIEVYTRNSISYLYLVPGEDPDVTSDVSSLLDALQRSVSEGLEP